MSKPRHATAAVLLTGVAFLGGGAADPGVPQELEALWADLATKDPVKADQAIARLTANPAQTVPFLEQRLRPVAAPEPCRVARWLADLDSDEFAVREEAARQLEQMGEVAESFLKQALRGEPSTEVRRRIRGLLETLKGDRLFPPGERLRAARAVEVLERVGNRAARRHLATLAAGAAEAALTVEAKSALERLSRSAPEMP
jgi:hypothetical protein